MCTHQVGVACKSQVTKCQKSIPPQWEGGEGEQISNNKLPKQADLGDN